MPNVHKDFHGALSYGLQFLEEGYGPQAREAYLKGLADTVYAPLVEALREQGLPALKAHWEAIFSCEEADFALYEEGETLVLEVRRCPAIHHMQEYDYAIAPHYCEHTRIVNEAICSRAGYCASVDYDQAAGRCVQRFWRDAQ